MGRGDDTIARDQNKQNYDAGTKIQNDALQQQTALRSKLSGRLDQIFQNNPWLDPTYQANVRGIASSAASGTQNTADEKMGNYAARTGTNSANFSAAAEEGKRESERTMHDVLTKSAIDDQDKRQQQLMQADSMLGNLGSDYNNTANIGTGMRGGSASNMTTMAGQKGWFDSLLGNVIQGGAALGSAAIDNCWIAEAIYGECDPRTYFLRSWLNTRYKHTPMGAIVMQVYGLVGRKVATWVRRYPLVKNLLTPLFEKALDTAILDAEQGGFSCQ